MDKQRQTKIPGAARIPQAFPDRVERIAAEGAEQQQPRMLDVATLRLESSICGRWSSDATRTLRDGKYMMTRRIAHLSASRFNFYEYSTCNNFIAAHRWIAPHGHDGCGHWC